MEIVVNGNLMRGLDVDEIMADAGARFVCAVETSPQYRLYSLQDHFPGMVRVAEGVRIECELWEVSKEGFCDVVSKEPKELCVGRVELKDGSQPLGVLVQPYALQYAKDITKFGGWRAYLNQKDSE